ncbi:hypothetical protein [Altericista sp. CCNU0014]|uniref:hypothetical protein n=1 Tax=Altericista sp. CCNU0014 TaxID=3082949 RepID=UPI00384A54C9
MTAVSIMKVMGRCLVPQKLPPAHPPHRSGALLVSLLPLTAAIADRLDKLPHTMKDQF